MAYGKKTPSCDPLRFSKDANFISAHLQPRLLKPTNSKHIVIPLLVDQKPIIQESNLDLNVTVIKAYTVLTCRYESMGVESNE